MSRSVRDTQVVAVTGDGHLARADRLVAEEPMEIRAAGPGQSPGPVAVTMRTPGHDFELAVGFLFTEGLLGDGGVREVRYCTDGEQHYNVVTVRTAARFRPPPTARAFPATASCGLCGKTSIGDVVQRIPVVGPGPTVARSTVIALPDRLRADQAVFGQTGGLHAAGAFTADGRLDVLREDVGRHNAVDKVIGRLVLDRRVPVAGHVLMVSGRVSFEIVQKAAAAGFGVLGAVSAPSSLAVDAASRLGMTVVGFVRGDRFNVYSHPGRIDLDA